MLSENYEYQSSLFDPKKIVSKLFLCRKENKVYLLFLGFGTHFFMGIFSPDFSLEYCFASRLSIVVRERGVISRSFGVSFSSFFGQVFFGFLVASGNRGFARLCAGPRFPVSTLQVGVSLTSRSVFGRYSCVFFSLFFQGVFLSL